MAEQKQMCMYCEHVMAERFLVYDAKDDKWYCRSMTACVHRMQIARRYPRPPLGYVFNKQGQARSNI